MTTIAPPPSLLARPPVSTAILRGLYGRCPACGEGRSLRAYLKVVDACGHCGEPLGHIRADDFPPYVTITIVGHVIVPLLLLSEKFIEPPTWATLAAFLPLTAGLTFWLMPRVKGGILGLMWHLGLKGDETQ